MNQVIKNKYKIIRELGRGAVGRVYYCTFEEDGILKQVAIKEISKETQTGAENKYLQEEIKVIEYLIQQQKNRQVCDNVLKLYDTFEEEQKYYIVSEFCSHGDLYSHISSYHNFYNESTIISMLLQIINGIKNLHEMGITHRDLKPENILLQFQNGSYQLVITDFGISSIQNMKSTVGTIHYIAPEILQMRPYTKEIDIWSFGCIMHEIIYSSQLFQGNSQLEIVRAIKNFKSYNHKENRPIYLELSGIIQECLSVNPKMRPTPYKIIEDLQKLEKKLQKEQIKNEGEEEEEKENISQEIVEQQKEKNPTLTLLTDFTFTLQQEQILYGEQLKDFSLLEYLILLNDRNNYPLSEDEQNLLSHTNKSELFSAKQIGQLNYSQIITKGSRELCTVIGLLHHILQNIVRGSLQKSLQIESELLDQKSKSHLYYALIQCLTQDTENLRVFEFFQYLQNPIFQQIIKKLSSEKYNLEEDQIKFVKEQINKYQKNQLISACLKNFFKHIADTFTYLFFICLAYFSPMRIFFDAKFLKDKIAKHKKSAEKILFPLSLLKLVVFTLLLILTITINSLVIKPATFVYAVVKLLVEFIDIRLLNQEYKLLHPIRVYEKFRYFLFNCFNMLKLNKSNE